MTDLEFYTGLFMAKIFNDMYSRTGLVDVARDSDGKPKLQLTYKAFMERLGDGEYQYVDHGGGWSAVEKIVGDVRVIALISPAERIPQMKGEANE